VTTENQGIPLLKVSLLTAARMNGLANLTYWQKAEQILMFQTNPQRSPKYKTNVYGMKMKVINDILWSGICKNLFLKEFKIAQDSRLNAMWTL